MQLKSLARSVLATLSLSTIAMTSQSASAGTHYNCATAAGCVAVTTATEQSTFDKTKYPIVMAHGLGGWTTLFGILDYWHGIPQTLSENGADVYITKTSSLQDSEYRGEQLLQQVKTIAAITGSPKVNLFGHSHGGHDIRYVAAVAPEYVASVTAISSPEQGSKMADWTVKMVTEGSAKDGYAPGEFNVASKIALGFFDFVGGFMDVGSNVPLDQLNKQDSWAAVNALTTDYMLKFNAKYPDAMPTSYCGMPKDTEVNGIKYYSWGGVGAFQNALDPTDYLFSLTSLPFGDDENDGLVSRCSSRLGYVIRDNYKMNHLDTVNQLLGLTNIYETSPLTIYRTQANRLKNAGL